jgi:hypothetical protein
MRIVLLQNFNAFQLLFEQGLIWSRDNKLLKDIHFSFEAIYSPCSINTLVFSHLINGCDDNILCDSYFVSCCVFMIVDDM